jgi:hypothetical protein
MNGQPDAARRIGPITDTARPDLERVGLGGILERPALRVDSGRTLTRSADLARASQRGSLSRPAGGR